VILPPLVFPGCSTVHLILSSMVRAQPVEVSFNKGHLLQVKVKAEAREVLQNGKAQYGWPPMY
jgi:hypothetical protein